MNLYKLSQDAGNHSDFYSSMIVVANDEIEARSLNEDWWNKHIADEDIKVEYIGTCELLNPEAHILLVSYPE